MNSSKNCKPKVVFVLSRFPYPIEKGDKLRAYFQIRDLSNYYDIYLICTSDIKISEKHYSQLVPFCKEIHVFYLSKIKIFYNLFLNIFKRKPFQVAYFYSKNIKIKIDELLLKIEPNHIFCQLIRSSEYVKNYHICSKSIDIMDALSLGMKRRMKFSFFLLKLLIKTEYKRLIEYEKYILDYFENKFIISEEDKIHLFYPEKKNIDVIPNGVNEIFFSKKINKEKEIEILFTGNMSYFPNIVATKFLYENIYPVTKNLKYKIVICGSKPTKKLIKLNDKYFVVTGWVDNISKFYFNSKIFIAPMFSGSGMQNKIIEAMASGLPCICSSIANRSIGAKHLENIYIADNKQEILNGIDLLMNNNILYENISKKSVEFVINNFNWKKINQKLKVKIDDAISKYNFVS